MPRMKTSLNIVLASLFVCAPITRAQIADPFAPTATTKSAAEIDREWQRSVSKYDAPRAAILREVDQQIATGLATPQFKRSVLWDRFNTAASVSGLHSLWFISFCK